MTQRIDIEDFQASLDRHGGTLARWPIALRDAAQALLVVSPDARAVLASQQRVDALLEADTVPDASANLRASILARAPRARSGWRAGMGELWAALGGLRIAGPAFATALVLGLTLGATVTAADVDVDADADSDLVALAQLSDEYPEY